MCNVTVTIVEETGKVTHISTTNVNYENMKIHEEQNYNGVHTNSAV